jgi:hypothetical protein
MRPRVLGGVLSLAFLGGCGVAEEKQWMKVGEKYTTAEFRNDVRDCSKGGKVDEDCMRARGWVSVSPGRDPAKPQQPQAPTRGAPAPRAAPR